MVKRITKGYFQQNMVLKARAVIIYVYGNGYICR